ncbi:protein-tyrosine-phosphatase MKP1-like [Diospyros lotus]|uniref:protein-tyrosine-phosphatase MKP1-like n=1 Tax=Diospyros lotus TaxID=55363 RepID=UPI0022570B16|nr:protein-tyrosine-phosphatase MKP1-like [Diospyros lotus]XP_052185149.1 protein-tyrosine-phosphatase MKP1-like [Diospyros lotus]
MSGDQPPPEKGRPSGATGSGVNRKNYLRSVSWTDRSPRTPNPRPPQSNPKSRLCLPPLQPLSISKRSFEEWPRAGSDDLGIWPQAPTPGANPNSEQPGREFQFKKEKLAFFDKECSRIVDHVYLGSESVAKNREVLAKNGITHVLNCVGFVCPEYFKNDLVYNTLWLQDSPSEDITSILFDVFDYFEDVREQGGRVLVHCCQGVSRSTSLVIAYLMWKERQSFDDAFQYVKAARGVTNPNMGFACQLMLCRNRVLAFLASPNSVLRMYRMAPHSPYDPLHLVPKMLSQPDARVLDSRGAFIIHVPSAVYVWIGRHCVSAISDNARTAAYQVIRYEMAQGPVVTIKEGEEPPEFWDALTDDGQPLAADGCAELETKEKEDRLSVQPDRPSADSWPGIGERKVNSYDMDFEMFYKALAGGVVPPLPLSGARSETRLPARASGWGRLRRKFTSGIMKEFIGASKSSCNASPSSHSPETAKGYSKIDYRASLINPPSPSSTRYGYPASLINPPSPSSKIDYRASLINPPSPSSTRYGYPATLINPPSPSSKIDYRASLINPPSPSSTRCGSPDVFFSSPASSPTGKKDIQKEEKHSGHHIDPLSSPTTSCSSVDSFSSYLVSSPKFSSKSPSLSPSTSDYSSSFTFSPSSSKWSDLSYLSSLSSPSGLDSLDLYPANDASLEENYASPCKGKVFPRNQASMEANHSFPCKGTIPSIAERRGSNPPPRMMLSSVDETPQAPRRLVNSWSFALTDLEDDLPMDVDCSHSEEEIFYQLNREESMPDADIVDATNEIQNCIENREDNIFQIPSS